MPQALPSPPPSDGPVTTPSLRTLGTGHLQAVSGDDSRLATQTITLTGDVTGSGTGSFATTLATVTIGKGGTNATTAAGARTNLGLVIGTDVQAHTSALDAVTGTNTGDQTITLTGDVTGSGTGSFAATLATVTVAKGGTGATSFTTGSVVFMGASAFAEDNTNFAWDNTNKRLGLGTNAPGFRLDVSNYGYSLRVGDPSGYGYLIGRDQSLGPLLFFGTQSGFTGYSFGGVDGTRLTIDTVGSLILQVHTAPSTPASGNGAVYVDSTSKNLCVKDDAGTIKHGVQTKAAVTSNFVTAISDAGVVSAAQPAFSDISGAIVTGQMSANSVTNAVLNTMPTLTIKGNNTGGTANALDLTVAQVNLILPAFTSTLNGLAPLSGGGTTNFLRADGTWTVPAGTGITALTGDVTASGSGSVVATLATVTIGKGGTNATTAAGARTNLGLVIGTDVQAHTSALDAVTGTNTGDQTITLTGDVTGSGTGSFATTLATVTVSKGGTGATSFATGSVVFMGASTLSQDNVNLFWDNTNKRLGIGTATPTCALDIDAGYSDAVMRIGSASVVGAYYQLTRSGSDGSFSIYGTQSGVIKYVFGGVDGTRLTIDTAGSLILPVHTAPSTPSATNAAFYVDSTSKNLCIKDDAGTIKHGVQTKAAVTSNWLMAISDAGVVSAAQPAFSDISGAIVTGQMSASSVTNAVLAQMPTLTIKGNNTGGTANALDLTVAQVNLILPAFTSTLNGLAPLSGGGTTNFLRADGTWTVPAGSGITALTGDVTASGSGSVAATLATVTVSKGGTNATTAAGARTNLGLVIGTDVVGSAGVSGGQTIIGGTGAAEVLTLKGTSNATTGIVKVTGAQTAYTTPTMILESTDPGGHAGLHFNVNNIKQGGIRADYAGNLNWFAQTGGHYFWVTGDGGACPLLINNNSTIDLTSLSAGGHVKATITSGRLGIAGNSTALDAVSGTNTGDQTITLTGDVTGSGTGSFAATIAASAVTNAKMANMATGTYKGNATGGSAAPTDIAVPANLRVTISNGTQFTSSANLTFDDASNTSPGLTVGHRLNMTDAGNTALTLTSGTLFMRGGNYGHYTGNGTISRIDQAGWTSGTTIKILLNASGGDITVAFNVGTSGTARGIITRNYNNIVVKSGDIFMLEVLYDGSNNTAWTQTGGKFDLTYTKQNIPGVLLNVVELTSGSGATYTPTAGTTAIIVRTRGGGAGGGGAQSTTGTAGVGSGGAQGGVIYGYWPNWSGTGTYTIGIGGAGGPGGFGGSDGQDTTFTDGSITLAGRHGTAGSNDAGGSTANVNAGGAGGIGEWSGSLSGFEPFNIQTGLNGDYGLRFVNTGLTGQFVSGRGGGPGGGAARVTSSSGANGNTDGAGGSGAAVTGVAGSQTGGNGFAGYITIWEYGQVQ
jgi:hypothetical protein